MERLTVTLDEENVEYIKEQTGDEDDVLCPDAVEDPLNISLFFRLDVGGTANAHL